MLDIARFRYGVNGLKLTSTSSKGHAQYPGRSALVTTHTCCVLQSRHGTVEKAVEKGSCIRMQVAPCVHVGSAYAIAHNITSRTHT
jgi:hypothetical protein